VVVVISLGLRSEPSSLFSRVVKSWAPTVKGELVPLFAQRVDRMASLAGSLEAFAQSSTICVTLPPTSMPRETTAEALTEAIVFVPGRLFTGPIDFAGTALGMPAFLAEADGLFSGGFLDGAAFFAGAGPLVAVFLGTTLEELDFFATFVAAGFGLLTFFAETRFFAISLAWALKCVGHPQ
jgi:hypothetical protein